MVTFDLIHRAIANSQSQKKGCDKKYTFNVKFIITGNRRQLVHMIHRVRDAEERKQEGERTREGMWKTTKDR